MLNWPAKNRDLNSIEAIWVYIKKKLRRRRFTSEDDLFAILQAEGEAMNHEIVAKFVS